VKKLGFLLLAIGSFVACRKQLPESTFGFYYSESFPAPVYNYENNYLFYQKFELGKALFYDKILSSDSTISCATCHEQAHAFGSHNTAFSAGVNGLLGTRNSPSITNLAWNPYFMWDGGINHIEVMPVGPITNHLEMNESMAHVVAKLQQSAKYKALFQKVYGNKPITDQQLLKALSAFMAMIISDDSKYDQVQKGTAEFTPTEQAGFLLFEQKCSACHTAPLFTNYEFKNNGLDATFTDLGRGLITQNANDNGKFKTPTLRNVELTYPYMHDGRFFTLNQVLDHYSSGIQQSSTLDPSLQSGIPLTGIEKQQLIAFLKTLTDYTLISNKWLMEPKN
jgi:cytochrome c peroxidase